MIKLLKDTSKSITDANYNEFSCALTVLSVMCHEIMVEKRAKLYEQSILEYKGHLAAEKTRASYKAQSQQCCKAIPNKPLPMSAVPMVFK